jgi:hypothetical protein
LSWPPTNTLDFYTSDEFEEIVHNVCARLLGRFPRYRQIVRDSVFDTSTDLLMKFSEESSIGVEPFSSFPTKRHFQAYLEMRCGWRILDQLRVEKRHEQAHSDEEWSQTYVMLSGAPLDPSDQAIHREVIESLPSELRDAVDAYLLTGNTDDAAASLGVSVRTVQRYLRQVRQILINVYRP